MGPKRQLPHLYIAFQIQNQNYYSIIHSCDLMTEKKDSEMHVAMLPTPGMGHLIPFIELSRKLSQQHFITITFILPNDGSNMENQKALLNSHNFIKTIFLPPVNFNDLPEDTSLETRIALTVIRSLKYINESLSQIHNSTPVSAFIVDVFSLSSCDIAKDLGIPFYIFFPCTAMALSLTLYLPKLDESTELEYRDLPDPLKIPGCVPIQGADLLDSIQDRKSQTYKEVMEISKKHLLAYGILVNGFLDLEPDAYKAFEAQEGYGHSKIPPVYPVGPLIRTGLSDDNKDSDQLECLKWLDQQPCGSVLFVSFGSGGTLSKLQLKELAFGLEMSEQRFIWVVKRPNEKSRSATYFTVNDNIKDPFESWYTDFVERTKGKGFVLEKWAPQIEILSHNSVGGFVTHCGWNSTLESIVHGVPLIAWPLFAEQRLNAVLLNKDLKVAFRVKENENGVVDSEQIAKLVRNLIQGEEGMELRNRIRHLKGAADRALGEDGNSTKSLAKVVQRWINAT